MPTGAVNLGHWRFQTPGVKSKIFTGKEKKKKKKKVEFFLTVLVYLIQYLREKIAKREMVCLQ